MAYYDFKCEGCGCQFEVKTSPNDLDKVQCPGCEGKEIKRVYKHFNLFVKHGKYSGSMGPKGIAKNETSPCSECETGG